ncbi:FAD dependent oxidoreductase [Daldinia sp. FL1419]|nr:FAD dependent oxidoreductase [Daldinia sp. FL1419]
MLVTTMAGPFPVKNATVPYWRTQLHHLDSHRSTPELPEKQDIAIIGAGFAGTALAHYLLKDGPENEPKPSITILEAREACSGATARNGGHVRPDLFVSLVARMQAQGLETANQVALFEVANAEALAALVRDEQIDCDLQAVTTGDVFVDANEAAKIKKLWDAMTKLNCPTLRSVTYHGPNDAERVSGIKDAKVAFTYPAHVVWPYKLVMHLLEGVVRKGVNLQTKTPVHDISETVDEEGYWTLATARGATKAKRIVYATNAYTAGLLPEYDDAIYAARGTVCRVVPDGSTPNIQLGSAGLEMESPDLVDSYYGVRKDGGFIVGGGKSAFVDEKDEWYRNYDDSTLIESTVPYFDNWAARTFTGWEGIGTETESIWTGIMGYSADDAPHIGHVPSKPGQYICAGFNGHGMPNVLLCAKGLAGMLRDGRPFSETGIPALYETSAARLRKISELVATPSTAGRARADIYLKF